MAGDSYIQVPADSIGKKVDTEQLTRGDGAVVEQQRIQVVDLKTTNTLLAQIVEEIQNLKLALINEFH